MNIPPKRMYRTFWQHFAVSSIAFLKKIFLWEIEGCEAGFFEVRLAAFGCMFPPTFPSLPPSLPFSCVNIYSSRGVLSSLPLLLFLSTLASPELRGERREKLQFVKGGVASREKKQGSFNFPKMQKCSLSLKMFHAKREIRKYFERKLVI